MNFNQSVDKDVVESILESSLWQKANVDVGSRESLNEASEGEELETIPEYAKGVANEYPEEFENLEDGETASFTLDDLQTVLDNLEEDDLMEHALSMLEVFDVAYDTILEGDDDEDEDEEEDEEEEEEDEEEEE